MTIKDLAVRTGYSVGTVSRVLNNHPNVSQKARQAILSVVEESGFQLNVNAKQLKQQRSQSILAVVKGTGNELFGSLLEALQAQISQTPYPLTADYIDEEDNEVLRALRLSVEKKPMGIVFLGGNRENFVRDFHKIQVPCVLITSDASGLAFPNLSSVSTDDASAAGQAIELLAALGHRRVAVIGGDTSQSDTSRLRYEGCLAAFARQNIEFDPARDYRAGRYAFSEGYRNAKDLLTQGRGYTALFAAADVLAIGAIRAIQDMGLRVPEDVSVMGFDGLELGAFTVPRLATICQNVEQLAQRSMELLLAALEGSGVARHEKVPVAIIREESVRPLF